MMAVRSPRRINYEALLRKYMAHVLDVEGATFVDTSRCSDIVFTPDELAILEAIDAEISPEPPKPPLRLTGTQVFIDGRPVAVRGMSFNGNWMEIDADGLPTDGERHVRVVFPDGSGVANDYQVSMVDAATGERLREPRFYIVGVGERFSAP
jgi:hypothetical protein